MKRIVTLALFLMFGMAVQSKAASYTKTISSTTFYLGVATSNVLSLNPNESMTYTLTGGATGVMLLEKSYDGSNFAVILSSTNNGTLGVRRGIEYSEQNTSFYRWRASTMTGAGSFVVTLDDNDDLVSQVANNKRVPVFQIWDDTIRVLSNNKGFVMSEVIPSTATNSVSRGTAYPAYLTGTASVLEGSVVVTTTPVVGQGVSVVLSPAVLNVARFFGISKSSSNINLPIDVYTDGIVLALTTGTVVPGDNLGTSGSTAGYLVALTASTQSVVGIALSNGNANGGLTKIRMR